jgi:hypothetical protein
MAHCEAVPLTVTATGWQLTTHILGLEPTVSRWKLLLDIRQHVQHLPPTCCMKQSMVSPSSIPSCGNKVQEHRA